MTLKLNHTNLFMNEVSSFVFIKKYKFVLTGKKIDFDLSKYQICFVVYRKKWFLEIKIQICVVMIKKWFLIIKIQICFVILKRMIF